MKWKLISRLRLRYIFLATSFIIAKTEKNSKVLELMSEFKTTSNLWLEKAMATHSSTLAWKIPWMEEPGGLQSTGLWRVRHDFTFTFTFHFHTLEKEMATHSSVLAWRIPGTGEPGRVYWVAQSQTRLKLLSGSSSNLWYIYIIELYSTRKWVARSGHTLCLQNVSFFPSSAWRLAGRF